jgi:polyribonucleotide nucleotidyltransferase
VAKVTDVLNEGDTVEVKVIGLERDGKIRLSRKALLAPGPGEHAREHSRDRERPRDRGRDRDREHARGRERERRR